MKEDPVRFRNACARALMTVHARLKMEAYQP